MAEPSEGAGWFPVARAVVDLIPEIGHSAFAVLMVIAKHADAQNRCWPSIERVVKGAGIKRRAVQKALETLRAKNLISVRSQFGPRGQRSNVFVLCSSAFPVRGRTQVHPQGAPKCTGGAHPGAPRTTVMVNDNQGERQFDHRFVDSEKWEQKFLELMALLPRDRQEEDHAIIGQLAWLLVNGSAIWDDVRDAFTAIKEVEPTPGRPIAYLRKVLMGRIGQETLAAYLRSAPKPENCRLPLPQPYERIA